MKFSFEKVSTNLEWHHKRIAAALEIDEGSFGLTQVGGELIVEVFAERLPANFRITSAEIRALISEVPPKTAEQEIEEEQDLKVIASLARMKNRQELKDALEDIIKEEIQKDKK